MAVHTVAAALAVTALFLVQGGQSQGVTCYTGESCDGTNFATSDSSSCCFGTGYSYNDGSSCQACFVIGWKNASMPDGSINRAMTLRLEERSLPHKFEVGCLKGNNINFAIFTVGPATETSDYDITPHVISLVNCSEVFIVDLFLKVDNRAMEQDETISLTLTQTPDSSYQGVFVIKVTIIDSDVVELRFNEDDYTETENEAFDVVVRQLEPRKDLDSEIVLRLIPVNYTYANESGFYTGEEIPFDPNVPNRAVGGVDYNDTIIKCIFPAGVSTPQVSNRVEIIDDTIDEDRQFFLVLLEVESATNKDRVKLTNSITKCNINDNDDTYLSFEHSSYFFSERGTINFGINIIKQEKNATATENVYDLTISIKSRSATLTNDDFIAREVKQNIRPNQKKVDPPYLFTIIDDGINEANESFVLSISPVTNEVQWSAGDYTTTTITIIDDDETPVFGFVNPNVTVSEGIGMYFQKVTTYVPDPSKELAGQFIFLLTSVDISASIGVDYTSSNIGLFGVFNDNNKDKSARISIIDDSRLEEDEVFYLSLRHLPGRPILSEFNLTVATFIIEDNDFADVGLEKTSYTVNENTGVVEICARVFKSIDRCPIDFAFNLTIDTIDGTAVSITDYMGVSTVLMFNRCAIRSCVSIFIVNDTIPEDEEYFTVMIGRSSSLHPNITLTATEANISISDDDRIVVGYERTMYNTTEGQRSVVLVAVISFPAPRPFTIAASTSSGTAGGGLDYTPVKMQPLVFNIGDTRKSHTITILDDTVCERTPNEYFFSALFQVSPLVTIDPMRATVLINDFDETECDGHIVVGYEQTVFKTTEGQGSIALFAVVTSPATGAPRPFTIATSTLDRTAVGGSDYISVVMDQIVFNIGDTRQSHNITIVDDTTCERNPNEQFSSNLVYVSGVMPITIDPMNATVVIDDFEEQECANCIPECENGGICIRNSICQCPPGWSGGRCQTAECFPECENGGTCTGPGVCQCPQGWSGIRCSTAECVPGCQNGGNCSIPNMCKCSLGWSGNRCQTAECSQGCANGGTCIIPGVCLCQEGWFGRRCEKAGYLGSFPCHPALTVGFNNKSTSVNEDNAVVTLIVAIQCGVLLVNQSFVVTLTLIGGSGSVGLDYKPLTAELVFNRTLTKHAVNVSLINDDVTEQSETFFARLMLMSPHESRNILLSPNQIEVEIKDDDGPSGPVVGFAATYYTASEDDGFVIVTVAVLQGTIELGDTISLVFTTQENNASAGVDYKTTRQDVMLTSGQGSKIEISIQLIDDDITESTESFSGHLMLLSSSRTVSVSSIPAEVVIKDNDNLTIGFVPTSYATIEGVGLVVMNVAVLKGTIGTTVTLAVSTNDISSIARKDFEPLTNAQLTISPKRSLATIAVRILNDNIRENWEAFTAHVNLVSPLSDRIKIAPADAVVLIVNDD